MWEKTVEHVCEAVSPSICGVQVVVDAPLVANEVFPAICPGLFWIWRVFPRSQGAANPSLVTIEVPVMVTVAEWVHIKYWCASVEAWQLFIV